MTERVPRTARWTIAVVALLVPGYARRSWRRQWTAELEHRCSENTRSKGAVRFALGSLSHAVFLRRDEMTVRGWAGDLRHSARALTRSPGFTLLTILTFAIGIGVPTAIFSLAEAALLRPLPMEDSERLVRIYTTKGSDRFSVSYPDFADFTSRTDLFESASVYRSAGRDVSDGEEPERIAVTWVHENFFQTLGTPPVVGRLFTHDDHDSTAVGTVVLAEDFWNRRFGGDVNLIGQTVRLDGTPYTVIGVVARDSAWPADAQAWTPLLWGGVVPAQDQRRSNHSWSVIARVQPGVQIRDASEQVRAMAQQIYAADDIDQRDGGFEALVMALGPSRTPDEAVAAFGVMGVAVFLVLLVACVNASGLLLSRASLRAREISLRASLGASRVRLVWMLLGESLILAVAGGATGLMVAYFGLREVLRSAPGGLDRVLQVQLNWTVLVAAFAISLFAAIVAGLVPALRAGRVSVAEAVKDGGAQVGEGRRDSRLRRNLVVVELALTLALLLAAGLVIQGFQKQITSDPGFETDDLLSFTVRLPAARYESAAMVGEYYRDALAALARHPGIAAATATSRLPLGAGGFGLRRAFIFDGAPEPPEGETFDADWVEIDSAYFATLGIRPTAGRPFTENDAAETELVAIVSRQMAQQMSPGESIIGKRIRSVYDENLLRTVVGVMGDVQFRGIADESRTPLVLVPRSQSPRRQLAFVVRSNGDPATVIPEVRRLMKGIDVDIALDGLQLLGDAHAEGLAPVRFLSGAFTRFGLLALLLALTGVYGLMSYSVSRRRREIGIRVALGASAASVRGKVLGEALVLAVVGCGLGTLLAYGFAQLLSRMLPGVDPIGTVTLLGAALLLAGAVLAASWVPARRATRVDPIAALRSE